MHFLFHKCNTLNGDKLLSNYGIRARYVNDGKKILTLREDTGEIIDEIGFFTPERIRKQQREYLQKAYQPKIQKYRIGREFVWLFYNPQSPLFYDMSSIDVARYIYIITYCEYQSNSLVDKNKRPYNKRDLLRLLNVSSSTFYRWYTKMITCGYLYEDMGRIFTPKKFVSRGNKTSKRKAMRIFTNETRSLYRGIENANKCKVGYLYRLIPYLCHKTNITIDYNGDPLLASEVATLINISKRDKVKFSNEMLELNELSGKKLIALAPLNDKINNDSIIVSTDVMFAGNGEELEYSNSIFHKYQGGASNNICNR